MYIYVFVCVYFLSVYDYVSSLSPGGLWSVFTLGGAGSKAGIDQEHNPLPLSNQSLLLLLVLANLTDGPDWPNPYRQAITCFRNTQGNIFVYSDPYILELFLCMMYQRVMK